MRGRERTRCGSRVRATSQRASCSGSTSCCCCCCCVRARVWSLFGRHCHVRVRRRPGADSATGCVSYARHSAFHAVHCAPTAALTPPMRVINLPSRVFSLDSNFLTISAGRDSPFIGDLRSTLAAASSSKWPLRNLIENRCDFKCGAQKQEPGWGNC